MRHRVQQKPMLKATTDLPTITPVIVTNNEDYADVLVSRSKEAIGTIVTIKKIGGCTNV